MTLRLNGSTSGYTELDAPAVAGSNTLILPGGNGTANQALVTDGSGTLSWADRGRMVLETAKASTSGTSIDFTGIPSWVKRVTVMFNGVSTNGTSNILVQTGAGSIQITNYASSTLNQVGTAQSSTSGLLVAANIVATATHCGLVFLVAHGSNVWVQSGTLTNTNGTSAAYSGGIVTLSGTLDRIRITTVNGTDTFDAGSINILYEG